LWGYLFFLRPLSLVIIAMILFLVALAVYRNLNRPLGADPEQVL
jgi:hypothetical protein